MIVPVPITVSLPVSIVVVPQDGTPVVVPINITSTSETALVSVSGLPTGLPIDQLTEVPLAQLFPCFR